MKNVFIFVFLLFSSFIMYAQEEQTQGVKKEVAKWGQIPSEQILMTEYAKDKEAEAVVLIDEGASQFIEGGNGLEIHFKHRKRIKILKEAGLDYAEVTIPYYYHGNILEKVTDIEAISYNSNGTLLDKTVLKAADIFDEKKNKYYKMKKFVCPNVKVGSIVEFRYKHITSSVYHLHDWSFQEKIPVVSSFFQTKMIPFYNYRYLTQGISRFNYFRSHRAPGFDRHMYGVSFKEMVYEFTMYDMPAFRDEMYISSIDDYMAKVDFQLCNVNYPDGRKEVIMSTWEEINEDFLTSNSFGRLVKKLSKRADKFINVEALKSKSETERYNAVIDYVKNTYTWNDYVGIWADENISLYFKEKALSCAQMNLLSCALLNAVGIECSPVISSTRSHGKVKKDYAFTHFFNYVLFLATVDGKIVMGDATAYYYANNRIPTRAINSFGFIVRDEDPAWIDLYRAPKSLERSDFQCQLDEDGILHTKVRTTLREHKAANLREKLKENKNYIVDLLKDTKYSFDEDSISYKYLEDRTKPMVYSYEVSEQVETIGNKIFISPFLGKPISKNPFKAKERNYPVDMIMPTTNSFNVDLIIPEGYKVDYKPANKKITNNLFLCQYSCIEKGNRLMINYSYTFKKPVYQSNEYYKVVNFFKSLTRLTNEKIVLVPIEETVVEK